MGSLDESVDTPFEDYLSNSYNEIDYDNIESLETLLGYPLGGKAELGAPLSRYYGAERIDIAKLAEPRLVRTPHKFLTILRNKSRW